MKAALVGLSPSVGMQYYTAGLANALVSKNENEVWVIGSAASLKNAFDARVRLLPLHSFSGTGLSLPALNLLKFRALLEQIDNLCPSLVHFSGSHLWNLHIALYLRRRYPLLLTQHDATTHKGAKGEALKGAYRRAMIRNVDCVVVHSQAIAKSFESWGTSLPAISVMPLVHHNFDYNRYLKLRADGTAGLSYENSALLFGRLEEYKGVREFLGATRVLNTMDVPSIKMVVAGTGRLSNEFENFKRLPNLEIRNYDRG